LAYLTDFAINGGQLLENGYAPIGESFRPSVSPQAPPPFPCRTNRKFENTRRKHNLHARTLPQKT
ncbi:MAG TPA: hypothetical protein VFR10_03270, partial [bacterium]|nr:hypothetical protein [bacterium]